MGLCGLQFLKRYFAFLARFKGACVPAKCDAKGECPTQGRPESGVLSGRCQNDVCRYSEFIAIA
jgi:hypothetical protein